MTVPFDHEYAEREADHALLRRRLITLAVVCTVAILTVTWGFDQADKDLRAENPRAVEVTR